MVFTFAIPLLQESAIAFQDSFGETKTPIKDARGWIYQILTKTAVTWVTTQGNGGIGLKTLNNFGKMQQKDVSLKEIKLSDWIPKSDPDWIPELWDQDDIQAFEIKIGTELFKKLENVFAITRYGTTKLNDSLMEWDKKRDVPSEEKESHAEMLDKNIEDSKKFSNHPIEKFLHGVLIKPILDKVEEYEKKLLDKEYDELYKEEDEKVKDKEKKPEEVKDKEETTPSKEKNPPLPGTRQDHKKKQ